MNRCTLTREIDAPRTAVWAVLVDVGRLPDISPSTVSVEGPARLQHVGDGFEQTVKLAGKRFTSTWTVTEFEDHRLLTVAGSVLPGTRYSMAERLDDGPGRHTTMTLTIEYSLPLGPLGRLAGRLGAERKALREAQQVLDGVARLAESDSPTASRPAGRA
jgi:uncharacterized membrane protein